eukprot:symbB.v1.2.009528.t2/scaffold576.1/size184938/2
MSCRSGKVNTCLTNNLKESWRSCRPGAWKRIMSASNRELHKQESARMTADSTKHELNLNCREVSQLAHATMPRFGATGSSFQPLDLSDDPFPNFSSEEGDCHQRDCRAACKDRPRSFSCKDILTLGSLKLPSEPPQKALALEPVPEIGPYGDVREGDADHELSPDARSETPRHFLMVKTPTGFVARELNRMEDILAVEDRKKPARPSYFTHDLPDDFPAKEAAPPNRMMHDMSVSELNDFLKGVKQSPKRLQSTVAEHRGEEPVSNITSLAMVTDTPRSQGSHSGWAVGSGSLVRNSSRLWDKEEVEEAYTEADWIRTVEQETIRIGDFVDRGIQGLEQQLKDLAKMIDGLKCGPHAAHQCESIDENASADEEASFLELRVLQAVGRVAEGVQRLRLFAELNHAALYKILKKHDKQLVSKEGLSEIFPRLVKATRLNETGRFDALDTDLKKLSLASSKTEDIDASPEVARLIAGLGRTGIVGLTVQPASHRSLLAASPAELRNS